MKISGFIDAVKIELRGPGGGFLGSQENGSIGIIKCPVAKDEQNHTGGFGLERTFKPVFQVIFFPCGRLAPWEMGWVKHPAYKANQDEVNFLHLLSPL